MRLEVCGSWLPVPGFLFPAQSMLSFADIIQSWWCGLGSCLSRFETEELGHSEKLFPYRQYVIDFGACWLLPIVSGLDSSEWINWLQVALELLRARNSSNVVVPS